jgi:hypothetical protein
MPRPIPDHALVRPRHQFHGLPQLRIRGDRAVMSPVQSHDLSEHMRIPGVALGTGSGMPLPVPRSRHGVDREHLIASRDQRGHPRAAVGLDPDLHPAGHLARVQIRPIRGHAHSDQRMQTGDPLHALRQPFPREPVASIVHDLHIVMIFSPVITDEQHAPSRSATTPHLRQRGGDSQRSNGQVLTKQQRGTSSQQRLHLLTTNGRTVCA